MKVENTLIRLDMEIKIWRTGLQDFLATYKIKTLSNNIKQFGYFFMLK